MFKFLKEKVKSAVLSFSKKTEETSQEEITKVIEQEREQTDFEKEITTKNETVPEVKQKEPLLPPEVEESRKRSLLKRVTEKVITTKISEDKFQDLFWDIELALLESNVAVEVIEKIKDDVKMDIVDVPRKRGSVENRLLETLQSSLADIIQDAPFTLEEKVKEKKPFIICFVGINGTGKTTSIAKITHLLQKNKKQVVIAAADTFRAAAIEQLEHHAQRLDAKLIKHERGSDAAAVVFDAIEHAKAKGKDVVLIDTAGRLHSNKDLMHELKKIKRIAQPDLTLFVGEAVTGNDCVEQAREFNTLVGIDGIILAKADIDEKGGTALSISFITGKPVLYLGTGQNYDDLELFVKEKVLEKLGLAQDK